MSGEDSGEHRSIEDRLRELHPEARARVENQLAEAVERELVGEVSLVSGGGDAGTFDRQHDRGPLFGKDFEKSADPVAELRQIGELDEVTFQRFAERLATLRNLPSG